MTHPAIDTDAAARLRARLGRETAAEPTEVPPTDPGAPTGTKAKVRATAKRVGAPVVGRARREVEAAVAREVEGLRREVEDLRAEVARLRAEHAAELVALREELGPR